MNTPIDGEAFSKTRKWEGDDRGPAPSPARILPRRIPGEGEAFSASCNCALRADTLNVWSER